MTRTKHAFKVAAKVFDRAFDIWMKWGFGVLLLVLSWNDLGDLAANLLWTGGVMVLTAGIMMSFIRARTTRLNSRPAMCSKCGQVGLQKDYVTFMPGINLCSAKCIQHALADIQTTGAIQVIAPIGTMQPTPKKPPSKREVQKAVEDLKQILRDNHES